MSTPAAGSRADGVDSRVGRTRVTVFAHVYERSVLGSTVHCGDGRAVLHIEGDNGGGVNLFAARADLARLRDMIAATVADLDAATATADSGESG